jgi:steroid 5-alpha reductase family enzyme
VWGGWLVLLVAIYAWATMAFGLRFSNLTYRGVLTHGPYRLTRHPAYVSKNLFWWSATLPFFATSHQWSDAIRNTVILAGVSGVYWWRGVTEARHLAQEDPKYRAYAQWALQHAPITRALRWFQRWLFD